MNLEFRDRLEFLAGVEASEGLFEDRFVGEFGEGEFLRGGSRENGRGGRR